MNVPALLASFALVACAAEPSAPMTSPVEDSDNPIDQLFAGLGPLTVEAARRSEGEPGAPRADGDYQCVTTPIDEVRHHDQLLGQLSVGDVLWPGSMLRGDSVRDGQLVPIVSDRAPLTFSVSLESIDGMRSATLDAPSLSSYREAIGRILAQQVTGTTPARISAEIEEVSSDEQLAVALGASASAPLVGSVKAGFNFSDSTQRSRYVVKFFQIYYTVDVDPPGLPHEFFAPTVTAESLANVVTPASPPVYLSSIGYGRQVIFTFESSLSKAELGAALDFMYQGGAEVSGQVSLDHKEVLANTHMTAFILGGDGGGAAMASIGGYDQLRQFIAQGGNYSADSRGAAIAYKLSYVRDHVPVRIAYGSEYVERVCTRVTQKLLVSLDSIRVDSKGPDLGDGLELYGSIYAAGADGLFQDFIEWPSTQLKAIAEGQRFPTSGRLAEKVIAVRPLPGNVLRIGTTIFDDNYPLAASSFGTDVQTTAPFEAGWRRTISIQRSSGTKQITATLTLTPVP